jgi:hypothetical protein
MKILKTATGFQQPNMEIQQELGDFLPDKIIIFHNDRKLTYEKVQDDRVRHEYWEKMK